MHQSEFPNGGTIALTDTASIILYLDPEMDRDVRTRLLMGLTLFALPDGLNPPKTIAAFPMDHGIFDAEPGICNYSIVIRLEGDIRFMKYMASGELDRLLSGKIAEYFRQNESLLNRPSIEFHSFIFTGEFLNSIEHLERHMGVWDEPNPDVDTNWSVVSPGIYAVRDARGYSKASHYHYYQNNISGWTSTLYMGEHVPRKFPIVMIFGPIPENQFHPTLVTVDGESLKKHL